MGSANCLAQFAPFSRRKKKKQKQEQEKGGLGVGREKRVYTLREKKSGDKSMFEVNFECPKKKRSSTAKSGLRGSKTFFLT